MASAKNAPARTPSPSKNGRWVWVLVIVLAILHWDFWFWDDRTLVFGFMPIGLAYQAGFSIAACIVWTLAVRYAWPKDLEEWADEFEGGEKEGRA